MELWGRLSLDGLRLYGITSTEEMIAESMAQIACGKIDRSDETARKTIASLMG